MAYRTRSARRVARNSKRNLFATIIICALILYGTLNFILPNLIGGVGFIKDFVRPSQKNAVNISDASSLAPPVLSVPYEATNTAQIDIKGFATSGSRVRIYINDEKQSEADADSDGTFVVKKISLNLGTNNIYGKTLDDKDRESLTSKTVRLIYDDEKPKLEVSSPTDNQVVHGDKKIKATGQTEPEAKVFINDTQVILSSDGHFSSDYSLNDGDNNISIKAIDKASNSTEVARKVTFQP